MYVLTQTSLRSGSLICIPKSLTFSYPHIPSNIAKNGNTLPPQTISFLTKTCLKDETSRGHLFLLKSSNTCLLHAACPTSSPLKISVRCPDSANSSFAIVWGSKGGSKSKAVISKLTDTWQWAWSLGIESPGRRT